MHVLPMYGFPLGSEDFIHLPKTFGRWIGYAKWPLGMKEYVNVSMVPCDGLESYSECILTLCPVFTLQIHHGPDQDKPVVLM